MKPTSVSILVAAAAVAGCIRTQSEVDVKPVAINLNITGRLELVITDARQQEAQITGNQPKRTVRPEDIGLPAPKTATPSPGTMRFDGRAPLRFALAAEALAADADSEGAVIERLKSRHQVIEALRDARLVGESHTGVLVAKGILSTAQQAVVEAENTDRTALYKIEAAKKKTTLEQAALGYYLARLEHVNRGTWVERFDKAGNRWEWFQWDR